MLSMMKILERLFDKKMYTRVARSRQEKFVKKIRVFKNLKMRESGVCQQASVCALKTRTTRIILALY